MMKTENALFFALLAIQITRNRIPQHMHDKADRNQ